MDFITTLTIANVCIAVILVIGGAYLGVKDKSLRERVANQGGLIQELRAERDDCKSTTAELRGTLKALTSNWVRDLARELVEVTSETARTRLPRRRDDPADEDWRRR